MFSDLNVVDMIDGKARSDMFASGDEWFGTRARLRGLP